MKQDDVQKIVFAAVVEEEHPLKQGLKQSPKVASDIILPVEEEHPLKQGLKLYKIMKNQIPNNVEEEHPLKQGLKHPCM